jgi:Rap1a immunity proteins
MKLLVFILACLTLASPLKAEEEKLKGTDLYTSCTGTPRDQVECRMWIFGFFNGLSFAQIAASRKALPLACFPDHLTNGQASLIVEKYMRDHPEALHSSAIVIAATALSLAFPCPGSNR